MNTEKYIVRLDAEERTQLETIVKKLKETSQKVKRAIVLLKADADGPNWTNEKIHELTGMSLKAISNLRKKLVLEGFDATLHRKQRTTTPRKKILDGKQEAQIIAMRLGSPPDGFGKWSLRLLADRAVELEIVDAIGKDTIRRTLKKRN